MNQIDWTPVANAVVPAAAIFISILLTWLTKRAAALLGVTTDEKLRAAVTAAMETYVQAAINRGDSNPAAAAAAAVAANLPDAVKRLGASTDQLERKAAGIIDNPRAWMRS